MRDEANQIVVMSDGPAWGAASVTRTHHRSFPEIRAEGGTALEAAGLLLRRLADALDNTPDHWHRADLQQAIDDVRAFNGREGRRIAQRRSFTSPSPHSRKTR